MNQEEQPQNKTCDIQPADINDVAQLARLFDAYRVFYGAAPEPIKADAFIHGLITHGKTHFFVARRAPDAPILGFVHLMPSIGTVAMRPVWLLEDLFVTPETRNTGVATALMQYAETFARQTGAERLTLATAHDNHQAQALYKELGYLPETHFQYFHRVLD